jgi:dephospho-CoA kinase
MNGKSKYLIGLTGGIGSGKSVAADIFRSLGICVVDADTLARELVEPGQLALEEIAAHFGKGILLKDGSLNRKALREIVFVEPEQRAWLESLLHPLIAALLDVRLEETDSDYAILESPLLLETNQHKLVNRVLLIDVSEEIQLARSMARDGGDANTIRAIIAAQMSRTERSERADDIVTNEGSLELLRARIEAVHNDYLKMAKNL